MNMLLTAAEAVKPTGNLIWLLLLIVGFGLMVLEIYLPGFGLPGISGGICLVTGIALRAKGDLITWLIMTLIIIAMLCVVLSISMHSAAKGRLARSKLVLHEVATSRNVENDLKYYVGKTGVTTSVLRPTGNAEFEGVKLNVTSDAEFIAEGSKVLVTKVEGMRILVKKV